MSLEVINASFCYHEGKNVFENINFKTIENDVTCILGPNGCGKTTLLKAVSGITRLKQGDILLNGKSIISMKRSEIAGILGYIPQEHSTGFAYSVFEVVLMGRAPHIGIFSSPSKADVDIANDAIEMVGVTHLRDNLYTQISGGERQLVLIARTLAQQPQILLLDEPTSHLDFRNQSLVLRMVKRLAKHGLSVIMTSHFPNQAFTFSGQVVLMHNGGFIANGTPQQVITEQNLKTIYGIDCRIYEVNDPVSGEVVRFCAAADETKDCPTNVFNADVSNSPQ
jgi:iron complex transport system ATP-binding protein